MEGRDPWEVLKCSGGVHDKTIINRILLSFRPIAPKPLAGASGSGDSLFGTDNLIVTGERAKRKYVRVCTKNNRRKRKILDEAKEQEDAKKNFVTLPLMPEKADLEKSMVVERSFGIDLDPTVGKYHGSQDPPSICLKPKKLVTDDLPETADLEISTVVERSFGTDLDRTVGSYHGSEDPPSLSLKPKKLVTDDLMEKADLEKSMVVERSFCIDLDRTVGNYHGFQDPPSLCLKPKKLFTNDVAAIAFSAKKAVVSTPGSRMPAAESWVTVESLIDTCMDEGEMGDCTDVENMKNLEKDTCPGFLVDGLNRVFWVNQAYKSMVAATAPPDSDDGEVAGTTVGLVVKDGFKLPCGAFSCNVSLQFGDDKGKKKSKMVPCDVWKMKSGGFAWRLDVKAALCLGL